MQNHGCFLSSILHTAKFAEMLDISWSGRGMCGVCADTFRCAQFLVHNFHIDASKVFGIPEDKLCEVGMQYHL